MSVDSEFYKFQYREQIVAGICQFSRKISSDGIFFPGFGYYFFKFGAGRIFFRVYFFRHLHERSVRIAVPQIQSVKRRFIFHGKARHFHFQQPDGIFERISKIRPFFDEFDPFLKRRPELIGKLRAARKISVFIDKNIFGHRVFMV